MEKKTILFQEHLNSGGKIVPFAGYMLPVQYVGVKEEHMATRTKAGIFDVSHMGEVIFEGEDALSNLNKILTNDFSNMQDQKVRYSLMCKENGGVIDDLLVYKINQEKYMVVINASNRYKDVEWMKSHLAGKVKFKDISDDISQIALQGPNSEKILLKLTEEKCIPQKYYTFINQAKIEDIDCLISRTGYTGEDGFEIYMKNEDAPSIWKKLLEKGATEGLIPCGLGARDTLRLEAAMPLYGHEMDENITPFETGLNFGIKMNKTDFIGKKGLEEKGEPRRKRVGLQAISRGIIREHQKVFLDGKEIGFTTSGTQTPYLNKAIAMALIDSKFATLEQQVQVEVRGKLVLAKIIPLPFYKRV